MSTTTNPLDVPWPMGGSPTDEFDWERLPYEIRTAAAAAPAEVRTDLLDRVGPDPSLTTLARFHRDGETIGVVLDGVEVLELPLVRLRGVDPDVVNEYVEVAIDGQEDHITEQMRADGLVRVSCPPHSDWVEFRWREVVFGRVHRSHVVEGFPGE